MIELMTSSENPESMAALGPIVVGFDVATAALVDSGKDSMSSWDGGRSFGTVVELELDLQFHNDKFRVAPGVRRTKMRT